MTDYNNLKVVELKELLKERGIATTAKLKKDLVQALEANDREIGGNQVETPTKSGEVVDTEAGKSDPVEAEVAVATVGDGNGNGIESDSETRKRKRRSASPALELETVKKKLKAAEEKRVESSEDEVDYSSDHLNETRASSAGPAIHTNHDNAGSKHDEQQGQLSGEDARVQVAGEDQVDITTAGNTPEHDDYQQHEDHVMPDSDDAVEPARHLATRALYIRELVRPLQRSILCRHMAAVAQSKGTPTDPPVIEFCHLDKLCTHALIIFSSVSSASRARVSIHGKVWPAEPQRKPLWADFIPEDKVKEWADIEASRSEMIRWVVSYLPSPDGLHTATLQTIPPTGPTGRPPPPHGSQPPPPRRPSIPDPDTQMLDAPLGLAPPRRRHSSIQMPPPALSRPSPANPQSRPFDSLDARFNFTDTKPKLYYQPVSRALSDRRMREIRRQTSRGWGRSSADHASYNQGELRRYTFEGDRLVDGGPDFGSFGRRPGPDVRGGYRGGFAGGHRGGHRDSFAREHRGAFGGGYRGDHYGGHRGGFGQFGGGGSGQYPGGGWGR